MDLKYAFNVEQSSNCWSAWQEDLCVLATGKTADACIENMREGCEFAIEGCIEDYEPIPHPKASGNASVTVRILAVM